MYVSRCGKLAGLNGKATLGSRHLGPELQGL
jgi:hypothetical protein